MDWVVVAREKQARYGVSHGVLDERAVVRRGNAAYAAGLCLLMADSSASGPWLLRAAEAWRWSWDLGDGSESWGRPVGALKAALLAGDGPAVDRLAAWTLGLGTGRSASPIAAYAAVLALLATGRDDEAAPIAGSLQHRDDFPRDVAAGLAAIAAGDDAALAFAVSSVVRSFETREDYLEGVAVADTALVLGVLARRHGLAFELPASPVLPSPARPARSPDGRRS
jgi:hypothetical protein